MYAKFFSENLEVKRQVGKPRRRLEDNIRTDLRQIVWKSVDWLQLAQDRDQWRAVMNTINLRVP
jgi:7-keto-8-aminopelargonate synthetase-like enzyme